MTRRHTRATSADAASRDHMPRNAERAGAAISREIERMAPDQLKPYPGNPKIHTRKQIRQIANSIEAFGFQGAVLVNGGNEILAGHGRVAAAKLLGMATVPCIRVLGLSRAQELAYVVADNKLTLNTGFDNAILAGNFELIAAELSAFDGQVFSIPGFETGEIDAILEDHREGDDPDDALPDVPESAPVARRGDLWQLGPHRLACGDARDATLVGKLMSGREAAMVISDPPWNVAVNGHVGGRGKVRRDEFAFASGEMTDRQYRRFLSTSIGNMADACASGALLYMFIDWRHVEVMCEVGRALNLELRNIIVWSKRTAGQGSHYRSAHELIVLFRKPGGEVINNIQLGRFGRSRTNLWEYNPPNKFKAADDPLSKHPTPKPVEMIAEAIKDASHRRSIVLDSFVGSGTTILAAEKVGRTGYGVEYEPVFCDLTIRRWQRFTGKDAILAGTGETFDEIDARRRAEAVSSRDEAAVGSACAAPEGH